MRRSHLLTQGFRLPRRMFPLLLLFKSQHGVVRDTSWVKSDSLSSGCTGWRLASPSVRRSLFPTLSGSVRLSRKQRSRVWVPEHLYPTEHPKLSRQQSVEGSMHTRYIFRSGEAIHSSEHHHITGVRCYQTGQNHQTCLLLTEQAEAEFRSRSAGMHRKSV